MNSNTVKKQIFANKFINGETVNWGFCYFAVMFIFLMLKQLIRFIAPVSASVSVGISALISAAVLFVLEKNFVFINPNNKNLFKQILFYIFRCAVDFGFYKIGSFVFVNILKLDSSFVFFCVGIIYLFFNYYFDRLIVFDERSKTSNRTGGRLYSLFFKNRFIFASVLLTAIAFCFIAMIFQLFPFGSTTVLRMDLYHQYGPLFVELYDRVTNLRSFIYSWTSGGGMTFLGNYFNYLSSPLSFIVLLFDRKAMPYAITTLVIVKGLLCSAAFTYYLKESKKSHSYITAAFGTFYAFCGYFLAYYWNIMWIDGMILFPVIVLGIEKIIDYKKPLTYIASLTILLYATYYIGYMVCIFAVIYFFAYYALSDKKQINTTITKAQEPSKSKLSLKGIKSNNFINTGLIFAGASLLSGMLCAATLIPVYYILQSSSATSDTFPSSFETYFDIINFISSHLAGLETTIRSSGDDVLPNIYCGILTLILIPLYAVNKKIRLKEKAVYFILIGFLAVSFNTNFTNFVWHAFHFPNDLPYRFSFMYSFILLVVAFRAFSKIKDIEYKDIAYSGILWVLIIIVLQKFPTNKMDNFAIYLSLVLVVLWTGTLLLIRKGSIQKTFIGVTIFAITFCEIAVADSNSFVFNQKYDEYVNHYAEYYDAFRKIEKLDKSFYREELSYLDTRMDPCLYDYNGISTFSSMAYENYSQNQYSLGMFGNRINSYTYNTQTPVHNMMYSIKYIVNTEDSHSLSDDYYESIGKSDNKKVEIYKNKYFLPIAFVAPEDIDDWDNSEGNPFDVQQSFVSTATGVENIFIPVKYVSTETTLVDCEDVNNEGTYFFTKSDSESSGSIDITIEAVNNENLYIYITSPDIENVNYYWEQDETQYQGIGEPYILDLGKHKKGDKVRISLECGSIEEDSSSFEIYAYNINKAAFDSAYDLLKEGGIKIDSYSDTSIEGTINAGYDGYIYTSIPYDEGWSVFVDGKKQNTTYVADSQLVCKITQGEHEVKFQYFPKGLKLGLLISAVSYIGVISFIILSKRKRKKKNSDFVEFV